MFVKQPFDEPSERRSVGAAPLLSTSQTDVEVVRVAEAEGGVLAPQIDLGADVDRVRAVVVLERVGVAGVDGDGAEPQLGAAVEGVARVGEVRRRRDRVDRRRRCARWRR